MADTTAPLLKSLNLPATVYLDTAIALTVVAQDDSSGVQSVQIWLSEAVIQSGADRKSWSSDVIYFGDEVESFSDGKSKLDWTLSAPTDPGTYAVLGAYVVDKAGNERTYSADELKALGIRSSFDVSASAPPVPTPPSNPKPSGTVTTATSTKLSDDALNLTAVGSAHVRLTGNASGNAITGNKGKNVIDGGAGGDRLNGWLGSDTLKGGTGQDAFVFNSKLGTAKTDRTVNFDKIADFSVRDDSIHLDNAIFKYLGKGSATKPGKLNKAFFAVGSKAKDKNDYLIYNERTGVLSYDEDGSRPKEAVDFAQLKKNLKLTAADFFVI